MTQNNEFINSMINILLLIMLLLLAFLFIVHEQASQDSNTEFPINITGNGGITINNTGASSNTGNAIFILNKSRS
jgi:L-asparagine transporter-like permease|uniref:Uncharacterized protein n=1 Tax=uncultured microorganism TaxID=358574 RepID=A0A1L3KS75_9ZZZZ|nr:hypothetical protein [uncultured microorganism]